MKGEQKRKAYPRQMIIPNKFIPMLKQSALLKARSSSNDLSKFLKPTSHSDVNGKTRQNLMNAMGMDEGPSQEENSIGAGGIGPGGGMEQGGLMGGGGMGQGMPGMVGMGESEGMVPEDQMGEGGGGLERLAKMGGGMGSPGGMNQINAMNGLGGMSNGAGERNPMEGLMGGNNAMNPMNNAGAEGMMSDSNQLPAGDPMGTLKSMLENQGTNAALGTNSEAFGPGGSANANVLAMLNQIVGKEMPGESPIDPSSKQQQVWDQLQKSFSSQRQAVQPYIDSNEPKSPPAPTQQDATPNPKLISNFTATPRPSNSEVQNQTTETPVYNLTGISKASTTSTERKVDAVNNTPVSTTITPETTKASISTAKTSNAKVKSQAESHENVISKTTSSSTDFDLDDNQPLSDDMVKFLKGIKFVVSQEPGNDIILGKKFTSDISPVSTSVKEENGVMKNIVSKKDREGKVKNIISAKKGNDDEAEAVVKDLKGVDLSYARNLLLRRDVKTEDFAEYRKAARVLERASRKLKDPVAKKSTEIAIDSILKVLNLKNKKKTTSSKGKELLVGGDVKSALSEKYFEAARVLATASKKLADPVAKKSAEIGIACILKVVALDKCSESKKNSVPASYNQAETQNHKRNRIAVDEIAKKLRTTLNSENDLYIWLQTIRK